MIIEKSIQQISLTQIFLRLEEANSCEKETLLAEIKRRNLSQQEYEKAQKQYEYFKKMKEEQENKPLPWYLKVACLVVPFSANTIMNGNHDNLTERDLEMIYSGHNIRQRREILEYSIGGCVIYFLAFLIYMFTIAIKAL